MDVNVSVESGDQRLAALHPAASRLVIYQTATGRDCREGCSKYYCSSSLTDQMFAENQILIPSRSLALELYQRGRSTLALYQAIRENRGVDFEPRISLSRLKLC
jgi:hypothetical protein